jgi:glycosyltransferase involved in cell wall biosynthesis
MNTNLLKNKVTIVIPTYNEEKYITKTIERISWQYKITGTRVIIADGFSTDTTRSIVEHLKKYYEHQLNIELIDGGNVAYARNQGAKLSKTKYTLFLDADSPIIEHNNIYNNINLMEENELDLLTCKVVSVGSKIRTYIAFKIFNVINYFMSKVTPFAVGGYFMTRTDKFHELGGFDESINNSEDYWLSKKYDRNKFIISKMTYGQDDRRFKKMGYIGMLKLILLNFYHRNNIDYFKKDVGYWN